MADILFIIYIIFLVIFCIVAYVPQVQSYVYEYLAYKTTREYFLEKGVKWPN